MKNNMKLASIATKGTILSTIVMTQMIPLMASNDILTSAKTAGNEIYTLISDLIIIAGAICFLAACLLIMTTSNERTAEKYIGWLKRIAVIVLLAQFVPAIILGIQKFGSNANGADSIFR